MARVHRFVDYLREQGMAPRLSLPPARQPPDPLIGFCVWMTNHRGVRRRTAERYEKLIERSLPFLGDDPGAYDPGLIRRRFLEAVRPHSRAYAKSFLSALRAFLRFLEAEGKCRPHLAGALPTIPEWKLSSLPRYLEGDDVERLIASCDLEKPHGVRDRAVLLLLVRLGLRAGDIVEMRLDDLDWHTGSVRVRGKGGREVRLPLPQDAGHALIEYVAKTRPSVATDRVFLCTNAPVRPLAGSSTVSSIVRLALRRAGIVDPPTMGAHLLRHTAATEMLRAGASLDAIASVLRHQSTDTTAYYAKIDIELLKQVAQPWPEGTPC